MSNFYQLILHSLPMRNYFLPASSRLCLTSCGCLLALVPIQLRGIIPLPYPPMDRLMLKQTRSERMLSSEQDFTYILSDTKFWYSHSIFLKYSLTVGSNIIISHSWKLNMCFGWPSAQGRNQLTHGLQTTPVHQWCLQRCMSRHFCRGSACFWVLNGEAFCLH